MRRALLAGLALGCGLALSSELPAQYVGPARCRACHLPQAKSREEGRMAKAYELLKPGVAIERKREKGLDPNKDYTGDVLTAEDIRSLHDHVPLKGRRK